MGKRHEAWEKSQALENDREMWKHRWDQTHEKLEQAWRDYEALEQRWEATEEHVYVEKFTRERDRNRLREAERMLRELGHPLPPQAPRQQQEGGEASSDLLSASLPRVTAPAPEEGNTTSAPITIAVVPPPVAPPVAPAGPAVAKVSL